MTLHLWWYVARSTGIVAWLLATGSLLWGMALATRLTGKRPGRAWVLDMHRYLGGLTLAFVAAHVGALVADSYVRIDLAAILVPFASSWRPIPVALGVVAVWGLVAVEVTSLLKRRLSRRTWHQIHLTSYVSAVAATAHFVTAGTDIANPALRWAPVVAVSATTFFLTYRLLDQRRITTTSA